MRLLLRVLVRLRVVLPALAISVIAGADGARAADGRIEINQARALAGGVTPADAPGFPVSLTASGSYVLTGDVVVPVGASGIVISADDVTLDLAGFAVQGPSVCTATSCIQSAPSGVSVSAAGVSGAVIENGFVRGFGAACVALGTRSRVQGIHVRSCGRDGIDVGPDSLVLDSRVDLVGSDGISFKAAGVRAGNVVLNVSLAGAGFATIAGGGGTRGNVCQDERCSRHARRRYYLTRNAVPSTAAPTACLPGYHMASFYELLDPSAIDYDTVLGDVEDDSGSGPVSNNSGWIRTGGAASSFTNCTNWMSVAAADGGTVAILQSSAATLNGAAKVSSPWSVFAGTASCDNSVNVWCVED